MTNNYPNNTDCDIDIPEIDFNDSILNVENIHENEMTLQYKIDKAISLAVTPKIISRYADDILKQVKREISTFESDGKRGEHLQACYNFYCQLHPQVSSQNEHFQRRP